MKSPAARLAEESLPIVRIMQSLDQCHTEKALTINFLQVGRDDYLGREVAVSEAARGQLDPTVLGVATRARADDAGAFCD